MSINQEVLGIYNSMPQGTKEIAAQKFGCARWYLKKLITSIDTKESTMIQIVNAMSQACIDYKERIIKSNSLVQVKSMEFMTKYSD